MVVNVVNQLQRRSLRGTRIKNFTVTCEECSNMRYGEEYCLEICQIILFQANHRCSIFRES